MKISVSSYSFSRLVHDGRYSQLDIIAQAKDMGFDGIEFSTFILPDGETPATFAPKARQECERVGIDIVSYTIGADFLAGSNGDLTAEIERVKEEVRVAHILGVSKMRHDATYGFPADYQGQRSFTHALPRLIDGCRAVTEFAASLGIRTMVENHGFFSQDSERVERLINGVNHPNFGALIDMGNFCCVDENSAIAVGRLAPYVFHVHAKDFHIKPGIHPAPGEGWFKSRGGNFLRGAIIGHGDIPVTQCLGIIKQAGYDDWVSIEFEGMEDPLTGIRIALANLRRFIDEL
ncbi:MAG TPA: sugar phosphate isomerase/epimerase family protein [Armatimonadota bacterium]|nr:sugar phosphate isomerase/epimerase family protein [Armatimonadota bacterium]